MPRLFVYILLCIIIPNATARAADAVMPVKVQLISMETWQAMQDSEVQTQTANHDANYDSTGEYEGEEDGLTAEETGEYDISYSSNKTRLLFNRLDMNGDGIITMTEYLARGGRRASEESFLALDHNEDGLLSTAELENFYSL